MHPYNQTCYLLARMQCSDMGFSDDLKTDVYPALKRAIRKSGLTHAALADKSGLSQSIISRFIHKQTDMTVENIEKLLPHLPLKLAFKIDVKEVG
jgi:ribosome-binding protein aMBF1 (putative translation factor)